MIVDIHTHLGSDRMSIRNVTKDDLSDQVELLLQQMDANGIDCAVLAPLAPHVGTSLCIEAAAMNPARLKAACGIAPRPIDSALSTLREMQDRGCVALVLDDEVYYPEDPMVYTLINQAVSANMPVLFHTYALTPDIATLINNVTLMYQSGKFVLCHMGGLFGISNALPLISRDNLWLEVSVTLPRLVESSLRVFLDAIIQELGMNKFVFGSEHHSDYADLRASLNMLRLNMGSSRQIMSENASHILNI